MNKEKRDGFIFYKSFYEAVQSLKDDSDKLKTYEAIINYGLNGEIDNIDGAPIAILLMAKPQIDANYKRYINGKRFF